MKRLIIHICGASGAGKTTLGEKLKKKYKDDIIVKDLDDLINRYVDTKFNSQYFRLEKEFNSKKYQKWLYDYIKTLDKNKHIVFVGLNNLYWLDRDKTYDLNADHKFYIDLPNDIVLQQRCNRFILKYFHDEKDKLLKKLISNNKLSSKTIKKLQRFIYLNCDYQYNNNKTVAWNKNYKNKGYIFMTREDIYDKVVKLLN